MKPLDPFVLNPRLRGGRLCRGTVTLHEVIGLVTRPFYKLKERNRETRRKTRDELLAIATNFDFATDQLRKKSMIDALEHAETII